MNDPSRNILITALMALSLSAFAQVNVPFEAEAGLIAPPFIATNGYVVQPLETNFANSGRAQFDIIISQAGSYVIRANVSSPDHPSSVYVNIDAEPTAPNMIWDIPLSLEFTNRTVTWRSDGTPTDNGCCPKVFNLTSGSHQLIIRGGVAGARLDRFSIVPFTRPPAPIKLRIVPTP